MRTKTVTWWLTWVLWAGVAGACDRGTSPDQAPQEAQSMAEPEEAIATLQKAVEGRDSQALWRLMSAATRSYMLEGPGVGQMALLRELPDEAIADLAEAAGSTPAALKALPAEELGGAVLLAEAWRARDDLLGATIVGTERPDEDHAIVRIRAASGAETAYALVAEDGAWKLDGEATGRLRSATK